MDSKQSMNMPNQEPEQPYSPTPPITPSPEGEPKPHRFDVRIDNPDLIFQAIQKGVSGECNRTLMESPLDEVSVQLNTGKNTFDLKGQVSIDFNVSMGLGGHRISNRISQKQIMQAVVEEYRQFAEPIERGGNYIISAPNGSRFVLSSGSVGLDDMNITTGEVDVYGRSVRIFPPPEASRDKFDTTMNDFVQVFKSAIEKAYSLYGKSPPSEEILIKSPKQGFGRAGRAEGFGGLMGEIKTPQDLLGKLEIEKPDIKFEDIGGQIAAKREIQGIAFALKNPELYRKWGTKPPKGVILHGPPGTGKTLMAKALAAQAEATFFHVEASDISSKWYGESEQIVKSIFELANKNDGKTIIFFDEIDAVAPQREGAHEVTQRVVSTMLENMDGMASNNNVMVVASTNRLDSVDPAMLRAGRFDRWVEVALPDEEGRKQIFGIHMTKSEKEAGRSLFDNVNVDALVAKAEKSSGSDIAEIIRRTLEEKVRQEGMSGQEPGFVTTEDILRQLEGYERVKKIKRTLGFIQPENGNGK